MIKNKLIIIGAIIATISVVGVEIYQLEENKRVTNELHKTIEDLEYQTNSLRSDLEAMSIELNIKTEEIEVKSTEIDDLKAYIEMLDSELNSYKKALEDITKDISYNPYDLTVTSNVSKAQLEYALKGTSLSGLEGAFIASEKEYGVNAMFLVGLVANESGWGESQRAQTQNNLTGYAVYTDYSRGAYFSSKEESILETARLLSEDYLNPNGQYHNGYSLWQVNMKYSQVGDGQPNEEWSRVINSITNDLVNKINNIS